ncbi:MAG: peptidoglycan-binding protein [Myxococcaceae bacterium]|nr:peptidoglycan-binding protein [Myxococcaceae bacterium]
MKAYQAARGLQVDGRVGQQTWGAFAGEHYPPARTCSVRRRGCPEFPAPTRSRPHRAAG